MKKISLTAPAGSRIDEGDWTIRGREKDGVRCKTGQQKGSKQRI